VTESTEAPGAGELNALARIRVQLANRVAQRTRLEELGAPGGPMVDITDVLDDAVRAVVDWLGADAGALLLHDPVSGRLRLGASHDLPAELADHLARNAPLDGGRAASSLPHRLDFDMVTPGGEAMGRIAVLFAEEPQLDAALLDAAEAHARQAAELVERARVHGDARVLVDLERRRGEQLRALADAALAMSAETEVDEILRLVTEAARDIIGTHQGVTSRLLHGWGEASTYVSLSERYARWRAYDVPPKGLGVLEPVVAENRPLRLTGEELVAHPAWRGLRDAPDHPPLPDYLAAPLIAVDGSNLGLIQLSDKLDGSPFSAEDEAIVVQLAQMASVSIENAELLDRERRARRDAEQAARLQRVLSEASHAFSTSLDLEQTLTTVSRTVVPEFADWCGIWLVSPDGTPTLAESAALEPTLDDRMRDLAARVPADPDRGVGVAAVVRTGRSELHPELTDALLAQVATPDVPLEELRTLGAGTALTVPLPAGGRTVGALGLVSFGEAAYTATELAFAEDLGRRAALALGNATSYETERKAADLMLRSLLPKDLPARDGVTTGFGYRPGERGARIGGDWYDVLDLAEDCVGLVVGDVMGHGVPAAAAMGQIRSALRAYAFEGHGPGAVLDRLDALIQRDDEMQLTTCVYATLDTATGEMVVASAGHLPPLVLDAAGEGRFVALDAGLPLGVGLTEDGYPQTELRLADGATFVLYTDGLVESRSDPIDVGLDRLRRSAAAAVTEGPQGICDAVLGAVGDPEHRDDMAILAVRAGAPADGDRREGDAVLDRAAVALLLDRRSPARARAFAREQLVAWSLDDLVDDVQLLTSELVTNAQLHGAAPLTLRLERRRARLRVEVEDGSPRLPTVNDYGPEAGTGRGMLLLGVLAERWDVQPTPGGKVVWFEVAT
jgi:GAF domain-containing protein/anti-sigma regulatory factor (Ser/Thr protein kinase)